LSPRKIRHRGYRLPSLLPFVAIGCVVGRSRTIRDKRPVGQAPDAQRSRYRQQSRHPAGCSRASEPAHKCSPGAGAYGDSSATPDPHATTKHRVGSSSSPRHESTPPRARSAAWWTLVHPVRPVTLPPEPDEPDESPPRSEEHTSEL